MSTRTEEEGPTLHLEPRFPASLSLSLTLPLSLSLLKKVRPAAAPPEAAPFGQLPFSVRPSFAVPRRL